jgi:hypothetical protein
VETHALKSSLIVRLLCLTISLVALAAIFGLGRWGAAQIGAPSALLRVAVTLSALSLTAGAALILFTAGASRLQLAVYGMLAAGVLTACALARLPFIAIGGPALLLLIPLAFALDVGWPDKSFDNDH